MKKTGKKVQLAMMMALLFFAAGVGQAMAVTIMESMDHVMSDGSPDPIQHFDPDPSNMWDVVRFDVKNDGGLGVYGVMIGANPGIYNFGSLGGDAMPFRAGESWLPLGYAGTYLPQKDHNGFGTNVYDWSTSLLEVKDNGSNLYPYDPYNGASLPFVLPNAFATYSHLYFFETNGPFVACDPEYCQDSVPIPSGGTFSFYVVGGLGSPFLFLTEQDYEYIPEDPGNPNNTNTIFSLKGSSTGSGTTQHGGSSAVPEPVTMLLLGLGLFSVAGVRRMMGN